MPPMITPSVAANGSSATSSAAQAGQRGRGADDAQGASFGAALERSRAGSRNAAATPQDGAAPASDAASADRKTVRRPGIDDDTKDAPLPADPNLAFLAPAHTPLHALTLAGRTSAQAARSADAAGTATVAAAADTPLESAMQDPLAKPLPEGAAPGADAKAAPDAAKAADLQAAARDAAARPGTAASQPSADDTPATPLHDIASAAVAAQTIAVGATKPAAAAGAPAGTAASGRASARTTASAATAEQLAGAAQPKASAEDTKAAALPVAAAAAAASTGGDDAQPAATPIAVQQVATVAAPAERSADTGQATRPGAYTVAPEVGSEKWAPALGQQLARMSTTGHHTAELNLNPAGLGPLKVTLSIGDNQAQAMFVSAHESVRKAVEAALPQLRNSLSEQGITLGQTSVGAETRQPFGQDAAFAQQNQQQQQQAAHQQGAPAYPGAGRAGNSAAAEPVAPARASLASNTARSGVDTFA